MNHLQAIASKCNYQAIWESFTETRDFDSKNLWRWFMAWHSVRLPIIEEIAIIEGVEFDCVPAVADDEPYIIGSTGLFSIRELRYARGLPTMVEIQLAASEIRSRWADIDILDAHSDTPGEQDAAS